MCSIKIEQLFRIRCCDCAAPGSPNLGAAVPTRLGQARALSHARPPLCAPLECSNLSVNTRICPPGTLTTCMAHLSTVRPSSSQLGPRVLSGGARLVRSPAWLVHNARFPCVLFVCHFIACWNRTTRTLQPQSACIRLGPDRPGWARDRGPCRHCHIACLACCPRDTHSTMPLGFWAACWQRTKAQLRSRAAELLQRLHWPISAGELARSGAKTGTFQSTSLCS